MNLRRDVMAAAMFLALAPFCLLTHAQSEPPTACPAYPSNLSEANADSLAVFEQRVRDPKAVGEAARSMPKGFSEAETFGARGDGVADDTLALQSGLDQARHIWLKPHRVYRISRRLELRGGTSLVSDGSATLLMAAGSEGFNNRVATRTDTGLYSQRGAGMRLSGKDITVSDIFIVKVYEDDRYVIGMDIREATHVAVRRVRMRGFSLAPGIVTIRSSDDVEVVSSLIHDSCTQSVDVPEDIATFQITGISVDDSRVGGRGSTGLRLLNNVIGELRMVPRTERKEQSDGINFSATGTGAGSVVAHNDIRDVDEGLDIFGSDIEIRGNRVGASGRALKLIHGASRVVVTHNEFVAGAGGYAIGIYRANPPEAVRQVHDILIEDNKVDASAVKGAGVRVDAEGEYPPRAIVFRRNTLVVGRCQQRAVACTASQCAQEDNRRTEIRGQLACID